MQTADESSFVVQKCFDTGAGGTPSLLFLSLSPNRQPFFDFTETL